MEWVPCCLMGTGVGAAAMRAWERRALGAQGGAGKVRVLVTGFHDFEAGAEPGEATYYECKVNPTARMVVQKNAGTANHSPPALTAYNGDLPTYLRQAAPDVAWDFLTLPVVWGTSGSIKYDDYDVVINMGQNSGLAGNQVAMELGAENSRRGADVAGRLPPTDKNEDIMDTGIASPACDRICTALHGTPLPNGFTAITAPERLANSFICNETHYRAVRAALDGVIGHGYFIHVPDAPSDSDVAVLAEAVGALLVAIVQKSAAY
eukprot:TRINITY_DN30746_c0_g1_i1.p2 TRINITY_DN30746_c0_g1~~TRINITY_DN30746_c0_g1_i1.p2  ORF type:complete len:264 (+),score=79.14 TRINITY_DN30746_c0_g1_i1:61-852(+)